MTVAEYWVKHMTELLATLRRQERAIRDKYGRWADEDMALPPTDRDGSISPADPRSDPRQP